MPPRIPLVTESTDPAVNELIADIRRPRAGNLPLHYQVLLNSPKIAQSVLRFYHTVRHDTAIAGRLREMVILRVAALNEAAYEFEAHAAMAKAEGIAESVVVALGAGTAPQGLSPAEQAAIAYAEEMTGKVKVEAKTFQALQQHFGPREIVDLTIIVGSFNMSARLFVALEVTPPA